MTLSSASFPSSSPALQSFVDAAREGKAVVATVSGGQWDVRAVGQLPDGRTIAWVPPDADTASALRAAISAAYGGVTGQAVGDALGLVNQPGKALSAQQVHQAVALAEQRQHVMAGVDFLTKLSFSANQNGVAFRRVAEDLGIDPRSIGPTQRATIDAAMDSHFAEAASAGRTPVAQQDAVHWLERLLQSLRIASHFDNV